MIDIDILQKQNNLTIIDGQVCIIPLSKRDFTTYPINETDSYIKVSPEDYLYLKAGYLCFTDDFTALEIAPVRQEIAEEGNYDAKITHMIRKITQLEVHNNDGH